MAEMQGWTSGPAPDVSAWTAGPAPTATPSNGPAPFNPPHWIDTVEGRVIGAGKRLMRAGQQIGNIPKVVGLPGLSDVTDKAFNLAPGTSWNASEPSDQAQREGGAYASNIGAMALAGAGPDVVPAKAAGNAVEDLGTQLQTAVDSATRRGARFGGSAGYLLTGHPVQALVAAASRLGASISGKGLQAVGQLIADDPDVAGKLTSIMENATNPAAGVTLGAPQSTFIASVTDQLNSGRTLTGAQRAYITSIYRAMPK